MQTRPYDERDGSKVWLAKSEQTDLLDLVDGRPRRRIALQLGLHGLRSDEIVDVKPGHVREIDDDHAVLIVPDGKTGRREVPIDDDLRSRIKYLKAADESLTATDPLIDVATRTLRNWIDDAAANLGDDYNDLGMHDLRRTWATDSYYSLAFEGVPIAEQLIMSWGGWTQTEKGRDTFRQNYLGPVPDHIAVDSMDLIV